MKTIMLSAAQMACVDGDIHSNLEQALRFELQAKQKSAQCIDGFTANA